jgi:hypothetical protein
VFNGGVLQVSVRSGERRRSRAGWLCSVFEGRRVVLFCTKKKLEGEKERRRDGEMERWRDGEEQEVGRKLSFSFC